MADHARVRWAQLKVGLVALTAILITVILIFLLTSKTGLFQHNVQLRTYMEDASGITEGRNASEENHQHPGARGFADGHGMPYLHLEKQACDTHCL